MNAQIAAQRLDNQRITRPVADDPEDVVAWLGAVQAQEYLSAKWALALRMSNGVTAGSIERSVNNGRILRTHVMRPTWHFVSASDIHWMLDLTAPRVHQALAYACRYYELDSATRARATKVFERAFSAEERDLTRAELGAHLSHAGVTAKGVRLALLTVHAELEQVICSGPQRGKQSTYALLARRVPSARRLSRDEALGLLTERYVRSHGPATIRDFVWWSGLTTTDAKRGLEISGAKHEVIDGYTYWSLDRARARIGRRAAVHLLPTYDEYLVAYRDLDAVPRATGTRGTLQQAIIAGGQVAGTWKAVRNGEAIAVNVTTQRRLTAVERRALAATAARYGRFLEMPVSLTNSR